MQFMAEKYDKSYCVGRLEIVRSTPFKRVTYTEAVDLLVKAVKDAKKFENHVEWGTDMASEHETHVVWCLIEEKFKQLVDVYNYPKTIKSFYTRLNEDSETVFAMDVVVPKVRHFPLKGWRVDGWKPKGRALQCSKGKDSGDGRRHVEDYQSYLDLRRFGTIKHSGFDLGFERMVMLPTLEIAFPTLEIAEEKILKLYRYRRLMYTTRDTFE